MKSLLMGVVLTLSVACGTQLQTRTQGASPGNGDATTTGDCQLKATTADEAAKGYQAFDINRMELTDDVNGMMSLCKFMKNRGLETAIFQMVSVTCNSCKAKANYVYNEIDKSSKIGQVLVFTDFRQDHPEEAFADFVSEHAPDSLLAHDPSVNLWKYLSANPDEPAHPTVLTVNRNGVGMLINTKDADIAPAVVAAKDLAGETSPEDPEDPEDPTDPEDPNLDPLELTSAQNASLTTADGATKKVADIFKAEYLIIDMSQFFCPACKNLADSHQNDSEFHEMMSGSKCRFSIMIPDRDRSDWIRRYPADSFIGQTSFGVSSQNSIAQAFGASFSRIPYVFMVDRKGDLVGSRLGGMPSEVYSLCKE